MADMRRGPFRARGTPNNFRQLRGSSSPSREPPGHPGLSASSDRDALNDPKSGGRELCRCHDPRVVVLEHEGPLSYSLQDKPLQDKPQ